LSKQFEERLNECLEALSSGQRTLEECLSMYPEDASRLEPMLRTAMLLNDALAAKPREEFAVSARERFLRMTEPRLQESFSFEPRPSFVMAARRRFLAAAQQMVGEKTPDRWRPAFRVAQFASAAFVILFLGIGSFAVSTSAGALPGDWRYPVKRSVEDIRYTLTVGEGARQELEINYAHERLSEIQKLADNGQTIGEGPLKDLTDQTDSLVGRLDNPQLNLEDAEELKDLAKQQQEVLADPALPVKPAAADELQQAKRVTVEVYVQAAAIVEVLANPGPAETATPTTEPTSAAPEATPTPEATQEGPVPTEATEQETPTPTPSAPEVTPIPDTLVIAPIEGVDDAGVAWELAVIGRFSVEVPAESSGWRFMGFSVGPDNTAEAPYMVRFTNADATAIIIINPRNGDVYWEQFFDDMFHEYVARASSLAWQASEDELKAFYPENAAIVLHVLNSIKIEPPPTSTPEPTATAEATPGSPDVIISGATPAPSP
jgi:hypothetical protein